MKTPRFWKNKTLLSTLLLPFSALYAVGATLKNILHAAPVRLGVPVICVGNATAGGAGKTPVAIAIGERLRNKNVNAYFLSKGYGGKARGPLLVNPNLDSPRDMGDEPLLLARVLPTVVAKDRLNGAIFAMKHGAKAIIMDDGFQNPAIKKNVSLLVVDGDYGFGNGRLLPAGPLREPSDAALRRADAVIVLGKTTFDFSRARRVLPAHIEPRDTATVVTGRDVLAFCGIALPEKFFATLEALGARIVEKTAFADHHAFTERELRALAERAKAKNALLVTTAKDAVRLSPEWKTLVTVVDIAVAFQTPDALDTLITHALSPA